MYKYILRPFLFCIDPERVHGVALFLLNIALTLPFAKCIVKKHYTVSHSKLERELFGIRFKNPVGLAAGFDKNATHYKALACLGFGFIEIGTLTPKPQSGNPKKRMFRLKEDRALINRMGFNNDGVFAAANRLRSKGRIVIGGNIGKNKATPNEDAAQDYISCFDALFDVVDYFVVNVSSPNTPNLRMLQEKEALQTLLFTLQAHNTLKPTPKPIVLKIAPDLNDEQLLDIVSIVKSTGIAGVIATNTTLSRANLSSAMASEAGGLSGLPLKDRSTEVVRFLIEKSQNSFPVIAVGGIMSAEDALEKIKAGASLVQIYTGFVYEGPRLVSSINKAILKNL